MVVYVCVFDLFACLFVCLREFVRLVWFGLFGCLIVHVCFLFVCLCACAHVYVLLASPVCSIVNAFVT